MKPAPTTPAIDVILQTLYNIGRHEESGGLTDRELAFSEAKTALNQFCAEEMLRSLPEKKSTITGVGRPSLSAQGYNNAIDELRTAITKRFKL